MGTPEHKRYASQANKDVQRVLKELGLLDRFYTLLLDEPSESEYDYVAQLYDFVHKDAPDLKTFLTKHFVDKLEGRVDAWCSHLNYFDKDKMAERMK